MLRATSRAVCTHFAEAIGRHGVPQEILTDNGKVFTGRFGPKDTEVLFDRICRENGIDHLLTAPRRPTTTGKIERFHRTLRQEFLTGRVFDDLRCAQDALDRWVRSYNPERPVLDCHRHPVQRREIDAAGEALVGGGGILQRPFPPELDDGVDHRIDGIDPSEEEFREFAGADLAVTDHAGRHRGGSAEYRSASATLHLVTEVIIISTYPNALSHSRRLPTPVPGDRGRLDPVARGESGSRRPGPERGPDLPLVAERVDDAAESPAVLVAHG
jgi:hypothetical protein